jgi:hypothetical protein
MPGCKMEADHAQANNATRANAIPVLCAHAKPGQFPCIVCTCYYYALTGICLESIYFRLSDCRSNAGASPVRSLGLVFAVHLTVFSTLFVRHFLPLALAFIFLNIDITDVG